MKKLLILNIVLVALSASAGYVNLTTSNGDLSFSGSWEGGVLPSGSSTGLVVSTEGKDIRTGNMWNDLSVRQTGGYVYNTGTMSMRGGTTSGSIYHIEDSRADYATYTNVNVAGLNIWSQNGEDIDLRVLSGHVEVGSASFNSRTEGVVSMRDGLFHVGSVTAINATFNFLSGGTGEIVLDDTTFPNISGMRVNFESGSLASLTFGAINGADSTGSLTWMIDNGYFSIDGVADANRSSYVIAENGTVTTIGLVPEPATLGLISLVGMGMLAIRRFMVL